MKRWYSSTFILILSIIFTIGAHAKTANELVKELNSAGTDEGKIIVLQEISTLENNKKNIKKFLNPVSKLLANGESSKLRRQAAKTLGELKTGRTVLEKAYKNDDKYVRQFSMEALANIANPKSAKIFVDGFKDTKNPLVSYWALIGLSKAGNIKYADVFRSALKKDWEKEGAIEAALEGLGSYGSKNDWNYIKPYCLKLKESYAIAGLKAAGKLKNEKALPIIERNMGNSNKNIAKAAIEAIGYFKGFDIISTLIRFKHQYPNDQNIPSIIEMLKKNKAAKMYALLLNTMNLRKDQNERSKVVTVIQKNSVVKILKYQKRKYIITDKSGQEHEDYWYNIETKKGNKGYLFGAYITVISSFK